jgi:hypothetical protein
MWQRCVCSFCINRRVRFSMARADRTLRRLEKHDAWRPYLRSACWVPWVQARNLKVLGLYVVRAT